MKPRWYCRPVSPHGSEYVGTSHHWGAVAPSHQSVRTWLAWLAASLFHL